jgi:hypothetical protein
MDELAVDILHVRPEAIATSPHRGTQVRETFGELVAFVRRRVVSPFKDRDGGIALGRFKDGVRRLTHFEATRAIGVDYDQGAIAAGDIFEAIGPRRHLTYPTHGSVEGFHKSRSILFLDREVDGPTFKRCIRVVHSHFLRAGIELDASAKDATRWWFCPVVRPEMAARFEVHATAEDAPPFDVTQLLAHADRLDSAHEAELAELRRWRPAPELPAERDKYVRAAVQRAADRVAAATPGERHGILNSEAYSLARLELSEDAIREALLVPFIAAAGKERRREGERTIHDACKARGAA